MLQVSLFKKQAYRTIILYIQTDPSLEEQARRLTEIVSIFQLATANEPPSVQPLQAPVQQKKDTPVAVNTHASVTSDNWETF
ncbi:hypothetical protein PWJ72_28615 [Serratia nevei]|nr:hypothetical protein [Serratia nevei]